MRVYACYNKNDQIREKSSSGGVFYELAKWVLDLDGVVFGARFDRDWNVVHAHATNLRDVLDFLGSKYVQSRIGEECKIAKMYLDNGKIVLFSGTPCQIAGLKSFYKKNMKIL